MGADSKELVNRRAFLHWGASASAGTAATLMLASCGERAGNAYGRSDAGPGPEDADATAADAGTPPVCAPTQPDAVGPFFEPGAPMRSQIADDQEPGERVTLRGRIVEQDCVSPLNGVLVNVWQADRDGNYHDAGIEYRLRGKLVTDADGRFIVETIRPGNYQLGDDSWRPAHIHFDFAKVTYRPFATQIYFSGDPYLPPNDGCTTCGSDDPARVIELVGNANDGWNCDVVIVMARS